MASQQGTVDYLCGQMDGAGAIRSRKMFGEYGVYCDDTFIGVICNDTLFIKITGAGAAREADLERAPAYEGAKPSFVIPQDLIEDRDRLAAFIGATRDALAK